MTTQTQKTYGVFIIKNGQWVLHCEFTNKPQADAERDYLVSMLGLEAKIFVRDV